MAVTGFASSADASHDINTKRNAQTARIMAQQSCQPNRVERRRESAMRHAVRLEIAAVSEQTPL
jgi:hypothetical protein